MNTIHPELQENQNDPSGVRHFTTVQRPVESIPDLENSESHLLGENSRASADHQVEEGTLEELIFSVWGLSIDEYLLQEDPREFEENLQEYEDNPARETVANSGCVFERIQALLKKAAPFGGKAKYSQRLKHMAVIAENAFEIFMDTDADFLSAKRVLEWLLAHGHGKTAEGRPIRSANVISNAMGKHGLKLPFVVVDGKKRYAILHSGGSDAAKAATQDRYDKFTDDRVKSLWVA